MLSVKDPVDTLELTVDADARMSAEELADRFRAFSTAKLSWRLRVARRDAEAASRLAASARQPAESVRPSVRSETVTFSLVTVRDGAPEGPRVSPSISRGGPGARSRSEPANPRLFARVPSALPRITFVLRSANPARNATMP